MPEHIGLQVRNAPAGKTQPVEVEPLGERMFQILYSPGLVEGVAAGDVIRVSDADFGEFEVIRRGGNIAIKLAASNSIADYLEEVDLLLGRLGGRRDGAIEKAAVWTVPVSSGFNAIEAAMIRVVGLVPQSEWWYGNVYDEQGNPLNWWQ